MAHQITLRFEDGVTRFIQCEEGERVTDAAIRARHHRYLVHVLFPLTI